MELGRLKNPISFREIQDVLAGWDVAFTASGRDIRCDKLCSIKNIEPHGIYYLTASVDAGSIAIRESVILAECLDPCIPEGNSFLIVEDPQLVFYKLSRFLLDAPAAHAIHPTAIVHPEAEIGANVALGAYSVIGKCAIGKNTNIHAQVVIYDNTVIGRNVTVESGTCIGATGIAWAWDKNGERTIQPQTGGVMIEDECFLGANVSIVRGSVNEFTLIGKGAALAHGTKIGHGVSIGPYCHFGNNVAVAGSALIGPGCFLGSGSVVSSNVRIPRGTVVGAGAVVVKDIDAENTIVAGVPAKKIGHASGVHKGVPRKA
jgi:UDP-3-O-[3-hydroxymyristoyl] glucosamine N-acyltransferase